MNKREYIASLREQLVTLPSKDVEEILKEFEMHFDIGVSEGKSESEISAKLGSPMEVAQFYLGDGVPEFDVSGTQTVAAGAYPIVPIQTWLGRPNRGVTAQTIQGFCHPTYAIPPKNAAPKPEPAGERAHQGGRAPDLSEPRPTQGKKQFDLPDYTQYPSHDPSHVKPQENKHDKAFIILFTIFVAFWVWLLALALLIALLGITALTGLLTGALFVAPSVTGGFLVAKIFFAIALGFLTVSLAILSGFAIVGFIRGTIAYIRFMGKNWKKE